jgi:hypothetical protein
MCRPNVSSDYGMGREGMSRRHKMVAMVLGNERHAQRARITGSELSRRRPALFAGDPDELNSASP